MGFANVGETKSHANIGSANVGEVLIKANKSVARTTFGKF